jgi:hypothetical protein
LVRRRRLEREMNRAGAEGWRVMSVSFHGIGWRRIRLERLT